MAEKPVNDYALPSSIADAPGGDRTPASAALGGDGLAGGDDIKVIPESTKLQALSQR